ncbi:MAG: diphthine synthase [Candidatus Micrarchaeia archaeon]
MTLILVGTGVSFDLTLAGLEAVRSCDEAFIETYTNPMGDADIAGLEKAAGKSIMKLGRDRLEGPYLVDKARSGTICLLASGDPLTATTHITLVLEAKQKGVPIRVIHNSSIHSIAPARAGLQVYRFGKTASLVNPRPNYKPTSSLDIIKENLERDLHTLVLLDTEPSPMEASEALGMLSGFEKAIVLSRVGHEDERISCGTPATLRGTDLGRPPFCIIVPARLHPVEEEFLESLIKDKGRL